MGINWSKNTNTVENKLLQYKLSISPAISKIFKFISLCSGFQNTALVGLKVHVINVGVESDKDLAGHWTTRTAWLPATKSIIAGGSLKLMPQFSTAE